MPSAETVLTFTANGVQGGLMFWFVNVWVRRQGYHDHANPNWQHFALRRMHVLSQ
jgi:hypothetical protein